MLTAALAHHLATLDGLDLAYEDDDTNVFLETLPANPLRAAGIFAMPGRKVAAMRRPGIQIITRGDNTIGRARSGFELAEAIHDRLDGTGHVVWGEGTPDAVRVAWCEALQAQPISLGDDDNGQPRWSIRFDVELAGERF